MPSNASITQGSRYSAIKRRDDEEAPHAVDDRGNRGEQLDRGADRTAQPDRREFGEVERDAEGHRHGEDQRQDGGDDGAVDRHRGAEHFLDGVPGGGNQEQRAELAECGEPAQEQHDDDGAEQNQDECAGEACDAGEDGVTDMHGTPRRGPAGRGGDGLLQMRDPDFVPLSPT